MIETIDISGITVLYTVFNADELSAGQIAGQKMAIMRLIRHHFGENAELSHRPDGSPFIVGLKNEISVSHCDGAAVVAVGATDRIGVDIERFRMQLYRVKHKYLSPNELLEFVTDEALLTAWTVKEAVYKAAGIPGLSLATGITVLSPSTAIVTDSGVEQYYRLDTLFRDGCCITLATPGAIDI